MKKKSDKFKDCLDPQFAQDYYNLLQMLLGQCKNNPFLKKFKKAVDK